MAGYYHICPNINLSSLSGDAGILWGQKSEDFGSFCSAIYLNSTNQLELSGCSTTINSTSSDNLFTIQSPSGVALTLKANDSTEDITRPEMTLYGDLSVTGCIYGTSEDTFVTGGSFNNSTNNITLCRNDDCTVDINVNSYDYDCLVNKPNHDNLTGFVANEHIDHSSVTFTAANGIGGGGDISSSRCFELTGNALNLHNLSHTNNSLIAKDSTGTLVNLASSSFVDVTGDTMTGDLVVQGNLTVQGTTTTLNTEVCTTSAIEITNLGTGPALVVNQCGVQPVVNFVDYNGNCANSVFYIENGGNTGLGITDPNEKLSVVGNISASGIICAGTNCSTQWTEAYNNYICDVGVTGTTTKTITLTQNDGGTVTNTFTDNDTIYDPWTLSASDTAGCFTVGSGAAVSLAGGTNIDICRTSGTITIDNTLAQATNSALGLVKIGYTESGKNYPVELSSGQMFVNVPWTDAVNDPWTLSASDTAGCFSVGSGAAVSLAGGTNIDICRANGVVTIDNTLAQATNSTLGLVKTGYTENGKNYPVELSSSQMYVNIPWTDNNDDTTYSISAAGNSSSACLVLNPSTGSDDCVVFAGGNCISVARTNADTITLNHSDTSTLSGDYNNTGNTFIQSVQVDAYGHITNITTGTATDGASAININNTSITLSAGSGLTDGGVFSTNQSNIETITMHVGVGSYLCTNTDSIDVIEACAALWAANDNTTYSDGNGIDLSGTTFSHEDTSTQANVTNTGNDFIKSISVDTFGHITSISSGTALSGASASHPTQSAIICNLSNGNVLQDITVNTLGHVTSVGPIDLDSRYYTETEVDAFNFCQGHTHTEYDSCAEEHTQTTVASNSANWNNAYTNVAANSANWDSCAEQNHTHAIACVTGLQTALDSKQSTLSQSTTAALGIVELATNAEVTTGTDSDRVITPSNLTSITKLGIIGVGTWQGTAIADNYINSASNWNSCATSGHVHSQYLLNNTDDEFDGNLTVTGNVTATELYDSTSNSAQWKEAYNNYICDIGVTGTTTKTITLTQNDGDTITDTFTDNDTIYDPWTLSASNTAGCFTVSSGVGVTLAGGTNIDVCRNSGVITIDNTLAQATNSTLGLVKIGYTESGKNYPVELSSGQMFVNVPWIDNNDDTTYSINAAGNSSSACLVLNPSTGSDDCVVFAGGNCISVARTNADTITINHSDTSTLDGNYNNTGNTFIQSLSVDAYGHIQNITTGTATDGASAININNTSITLSAGDGLTDGGAFSTNQSNIETITMHVGVGSYLCVNTDSIDVIEACAALWTANDNTNNYLTGGSFNEDQLTLGVKDLTNVTVDLSGYNYNCLTNKPTIGSGSVTSVSLTAGSLIDIVGGPITTSGNIGVHVDLTELPDMTGDMTCTEDELVVLDNSVQKRKSINEIKLSCFCNDSQWTSCQGDITEVVAGTELSGGGSAGSVTINHNNISRGNTTSGCTVCHLGSFTVVDSVSSNARGHITGINTKTVTISADSGGGGGGGGGGAGIATSTSLGLVKLASDTTQTVAFNTVSSTANRTYGLQFNSSNQLVVNVPWSDTNDNTTYSQATTSALGLVELATGTEVDIGSDANRAITPSNLTSITKLGTIGTGTWQGTAIADAYIASASNWNSCATSGHVHSQYLLNNADDEFDGNLTVTGNVTAAQLYEGSNRVCTASYPTVSDAIICISGGTALGGGGDFTLNQSGNETITINHDNITRTNNSSTGSPSYGGTFTVIDSITSSAQGHITAVNTKTVTLPSADDTNTTYTLNAIDGSGDVTIRLSGTDSSTDDVILCGSSGVSINSSGDVVTIAGPNLSSYCQTHSHSEYASCAEGHTQTTVASNSANWNNAYTNVAANSANWNSCAETNHTHAIACVTGLQTALDSKQDCLTFGIANTNAVCINSTSVANNEYAKFTSSGLSGRSIEEVKEDIGLGSIYNCASTDFDKYTGWVLYTDTACRGTITSAEEVRFCGGNCVDLSYAATNNVITINHADTSTLNGASNNSGNVFIQDLTFDSYGHVTAIGTGTSTHSDTTYGISSVDVAGTAEVKLRLTDSGSGTDDVTICATQNLTINSAGDIISITGPNLSSYCQSHTHSQYLLNNANDEFDGNLTVTGNVTAAQLYEGSNRVCTAAYPTVSDATICISGGTALGGGGDFTLNQSGNETITINHDSVTRTNTSNSNSPGYAGTFTTIDSITSSAQGHITAVNTKTVTLPSADDTNTTYTLNAIDGSGDVTIRLTGTDSSTDDVILCGSSGVSINSSGDIVTIAGPNLSSYCQTHTHTEYASCATSNHVHSQYLLDTTDTLTGNLTVTGNITAAQLYEGSNRVCTSSYPTVPGAATASDLGLVKIGYIENNKNYPVELSSEKMYVNVPWTDNNTTYTQGLTTETDGVKILLTPSTGTATSYCIIGANDTTVSVTGSVITIDTDIDLSNYATTSHNHTLDGLSNVTITSNSNGEILKWSGSEWVNNTLTEAGIQSTLNFGIANTNAVSINSTSVADNEYARFTASGLESRSVSEVISDLSVLKNTTDTLTGNLTVTGNVTAAQLYEGSNRVCTDDYPTVSNATICISGGTALGGGGDFTLNQSGNETITINHDSVTRTNNSSSSSPGYAGTFTTIDSITSSAQGHITAVNTKTVTLPSVDDTNTTYTLNAIDGSGDVTIRLTGTDSTDDDVILCGSSGVSINSSGDVITIAGPNLSSYCQTHTHTEYASCAEGHTQTTVASNSANWNNAYTNVAANSANWDSCATAANITSLTNSLASKQDSLNFGIENENAVCIIANDVEEGDYAKFGLGGLVGQSISQLKTDIGVGDDALTQKNFTDTLKAKLDNIAANANNYSLPVAEAAVLGGIELASDTDQSVAANDVTAVAGRTYGIQLNSANQAVVNVPWDTITPDVTATNDGAKLQYTGIGGGQVGVGSTCDIEIKGTGATTVDSDGTSITISSTDNNDNTTYSIAAVNVSGTTSAKLRLSSLSPSGTDDVTFVVGQNLTIQSGDANTITITGPDLSSYCTSNITYSQASNSTLGLVKIGYTESGKNYPVELSSGKMYVNVPWSDNNTTYSQATTTGLGLVELATDNEVCLSSSTTKVITPSSLKCVTKLGTITTGVWEGTAIADAHIASASNWNNAYTNVAANSANWNDCATDDHEHSQYLLNNADDEFDGSLTVTGNVTAAQLYEGSDRVCTDAYPTVPVAATAGNLGTVKLASNNNAGAFAISTTSNRTYGVQFNDDTNQQLVVNVPWTDNNTTVTPEVVDTTNGAGIKISGMVGVGSECTIDIVGVDDMDVNVSATEGTLEISSTKATNTETSAGAISTRSLTPANLTSITKLGTITEGTWQGTAIADTYISSASNWNNAYTNVAANSANWNNAYTNVAANSANWNDCATDDHVHSQYLVNNADNTLTGNLTVIGNVSAAQLYEGSDRVCTSAYPTVPGAATDAALGLVKLESGSVQSCAANAITETGGRTYGLQLNSSNQLVVNVPWSDNNTTYSLATSTTLGLVKIGYTESGKNYPVELSSSKMYVNVPWTDNNTTYSAATDAALGLVKLESAAVQSCVANAITETGGRTYGVQFNSSNQLVVNVPWSDTNTNTNYYANSLSFSNGTLTVGRSVLSDLTVSLDGRYCTSNTNNYANSASFNSSDGNLTIGRSGSLSDLIVCLDGRYSTSDNNTTYSAGDGIGLTGTTFSVAGGTGLTQETSGLCITTACRTAIANGDTAHGWGNHASANYLTEHPDTNTAISSSTTFGGQTGAIARPGKGICYITTDSNGHMTAIGFTNELCTYHPNTSNLDGIQEDTGDTAINSITLDSNGHVLNVSHIGITTSSDYRAKTCIEQYVAGYESVKNVDTYEYIFKDDDDEKQHIGMMAHELQENGVVYGVSGYKDEVDEDGAPVLQTVNLQKLVPTLWSALKAAINKIEDLESRIDKMELQSDT